MTIRPLFPLLVLPALLLTGCGEEEKKAEQDRVNKEIARQVSGAQYNMEAFVRQEVQRQLAQAVADHQRKREEALRQIEEQKKADAAAKTAPKPGAKPPVSGAPVIKPPAKPPTNR